MFQSPMMIVSGGNIELAVFILSVGLQFLSFWPKYQKGIERDPIPIFVLTVL